MFHWFRRSFPWFNTRDRNPDSTSTPDLNMIYHRFQSLPKPPPEDRIYYDRLKTMLQGLIAEAGDLELKPDFFKLMLELLITELHIPFETIKFDFKLMKGEWSLDFQQRHWAVPLITENLARYLDEEGGPNFAEVVLKMVAGGLRPPNVPGFTLTLQRLDGKAPADMLHECKQELETLQAELRHWRKSHAWLEGRNVSLAQLDDTNPYVGKSEPELERAWDDGWLSEVTFDESELEEERQEREPENVAIAHIYAQRSPHAPAYIVGNTQGLRNLVNALCHTLTYSRAQKTKLSAVDGEAYDCWIVRQEQADCDLKLPYTDSGYQREAVVSPWSLVKNVNPNA